MQLPTISNYMDYSSSNYGAHSLLVTMGPLRVWYSYRTPVAFSWMGPAPMVVHQNVWGTTTGKHLNMIDGGDKEARKQRVDGEHFQAMWDEHVAPLLDGVTV